MELCFLTFGKLEKARSFSRHHEPCQSIIAYFMEVLAPIIEILEYAFRSMSNEN